jgi:hypothetical protein
MKRITERSAPKPSTNQRLAENEEVDRMLSSPGKDEILPSSGFALAVMDAVRREAAAPPPIPFPWRRALPGMIVAGLVFVLALISLVVLIVHLPASTIPQVSASLPSSAQLGLHEDIELATKWTALALLLAFVSVKLSMRLAASRT